MSITYHIWIYNNNNVIEIIRVINYFILLIINLFIYKCSFIYLLLKNYSNQFIHNNLTNIINNL